MSNFALAVHQSMPIDLPVSYFVKMVLLDENVECQQQDMPLSFVGGCT